jgi:hypothetical protein
MGAASYARRRLMAKKKSKEFQYPTTLYVKHEDPDNDGGFFNSSDQPGAVLDGDGPEVVAVYRLQRLERISRELVFEEI